jgi:hypothetical protein
MHHSSSDIVTVTGPDSDPARSGNRMNGPGFPRMSGPRRLLSRGPLNPLSKPRQFIHPATPKSRRRRRRPRFGPASAAGRSAGPNRIDRPGLRVGPAYRHRHTRSAPAAGAAASAGGVGSAPAGSGDPWPSESGPGRATVPPARGSRCRQPRARRRASRRPAHTAAATLAPTTAAAAVATARPALARRAMAAAAAAAAAAGSAGGGGGVPSGGGRELKGPWWRCRPGESDTRAYRIKFSAHQYD